MQIIEGYSHLNGEEYLIVHHKDTYEEIIDVIHTLDAEKCKTKVSREHRKKDRLLYSPEDLNCEFKRLFYQRNWTSVCYPYYVTTDYSIMQKLLALPLDHQKEFLIGKGVFSPIYTFKQTDLVKENISVEVRFDECPFVAHDLFVKHQLFYSGGIIDVGVEILPMKSMQAEMSSEIAYYEGEVYNVLRHGRNDLPVPLLIIGVGP